MELKSLSSVFKQRIYRIPDYQRGYAWQKVQLRDFWEDMVNLDDKRSHYTGLLTLRLVDKRTIDQESEEYWLVDEHGYGLYHVVDGQQRLTTSVILLQSLVDICRVQSASEPKDDAKIYLGSVKLSEIIEQYLVKVHPQQVIHTYLFGYTADNPSFRYLRHKILGEESPGTLQETFYTLNLGNAKEYFDEQLKSIVAEQGIDGLRTIFKKLTQQLRFNEYIIEDDFDVFVAFETMNNRGRKLSGLELLKNRMIYLTTLYPPSETTADTIANLRQRINDAWKEVYYQLGRNHEHPLNDDDFLKAHWITYFKYSREESKDYIHDLLKNQFTPMKIYEKKEVDVPLAAPEETHDTLTFEEPDDDISDMADNSTSQTRTVSKLRPTEISQYVGSIKDSARHWFNTFFPLLSTDLSPSEKEWIDKLNRIGMGYFRPLIMSMFITEKDEDVRVDVLKEIERFIFVCFRMCRALSNYKSSVFYNTSRELFRGEISPGLIIQQLHEHMKWCFNDDGTLKQKYLYNYLEPKFRDLTGKGYYSWYGPLQYFLYEYELDLMKSRGQSELRWNLFTKNEKDKVSIEHILPHTPDNVYWKKLFYSYNEKQIASLSGSLGNLLPLSHAINASLQNDSFPDKKNLRKDDSGKVIRNGYKNGSHSEREVADNYQDWTAESIKARGLRLLDFMSERWGFSFRSPEDKESLLFLNFLKG